MGYNSVVSGYPKSTGISRVDGLSTGPPGFGASQLVLGVAWSMVSSTFPVRPDKFQFLE